MTLSTEDLAHLLVSLCLLLTAAHGCGYVLAHLRMPRVIGEILGGLLLGPTLLGAVAPELQSGLFPPEGPTASVLGAVYQLGLLLLMFCSGAEIRASARGGGSKTVALIAICGTIFPFAAGLLAVTAFDVTGLIGPAGNSTSFLLVFAIAIAVTSIPVISRIMLDLGLLETSFARVVLGAAVIEDVLLYVGLAVAVGLVQSGQGEAFGVAAALHSNAGPLWSTVYYVVATLAVIGVVLRLGPSLFRRALQWRYNLLNRSNPLAFQIVLLLAVTFTCVVLGIAPMFGAFIAGTMVTSKRLRQERAHDAIKSFSFAFFVPVYFAIVGLRLDLVRQFSPVFFVLFMVFACVAKSLSVYVGSRLAGEGRWGAANFAVAMNARGGPGIVLASVAFDALIISETFYSALVMLAIVTSLVAGAWLEAVVRSGRPLRDREGAAVGRSAKEHSALGLRPAPVRRYSGKRTR
jgi:Kef-type K+ transport system membrane component KefB